MADCTTCRERGPGFSLREPHVSSPAWDTFDPTGGLTELGEGRFECPACHSRWRRRAQAASFFHDYDEYDFTREA